MTQTIAALTPRRPMTRAQREKLNRSIANLMAEVAAIKADVEELRDSRPAKPSPVGRPGQA